MSEQPESLSIQAPNVRIHFMADGPYANFDDICRLVAELGGLTPIALAEMGRRLKEAQSAPVGIAELEKFLQEGGTGDPPDTR